MEKGNLYGKEQGPKIVALGGGHGLSNMLRGLKTVTPDLTAMQNSDNWTELMVIQEELKTMPFGEIWTEYCRVCGVPADGEWFAEVKKYEAEVLSKRN